VSSAVTSGGTRASIDPRVVRCNLLKMWPTGVRRHRLWRVRFHFIYRDAYRRGWRNICAFCAQSQSFLLGNHFCGLSPWIYRFQRLLMLHGICELIDRTTLSQNTLNYARVKQQHSSQGTAPFCTCFVCIALSQRFRNTTHVDFQLPKTLSIPLTPTTTTAVVGLGPRLGFYSVHRHILFPLTLCSERLPLAPPTLISAKLRIDLNITF
jgi:hypothetical protein